MVGDILLIYDDTGRPLYTIEWPWHPGTMAMLTERGEYWVQTPKVDLHSVYVDYSSGLAEVKDRVAGPWTATNFECPSDGETAFSITGLPAGAIVSVGDIEYPDPGFFEFISTNPGSYTIRVRAWPYLDAQYEVTFT
jgi:hypothetical protein